MIKVENLTKRYAGQTAIQDLNFEVSRGEIMGFLGPNGAGKTTTMRILAGFMPPTSGRATIAGFNVLDNRFRPARISATCPKTYRSIAICV